MKKSKILLLLLALMTAFALALVGCGGGGGGNSSSTSEKPSDSQSESASESESESEETEYYLTLGQTSILMTLGDENTPLDPRYNLQSGAELTFSSSNPSIVSVDEYGRLNAIKVGAAVITVRYGSLSATCDVEVGLNDLLPVLQLTNVAGEELVIDRETLVDLSATVLFNSKTF